MGRLVPTIRTVATDYEMCKAIIVAWKELYNEIPKKQSVCIIMAQHMLETGGNACWSWNIANIKYVAANGDVDYCVLKGVWEMVNGKRVELSPNDPGSWFRAFNTLDEGTKFYLQFLNGRRYKTAWNAIVAGDPAQFVHLLHVAGYFTAPEADYLKAELIYYNKYMRGDLYEKALQEIEANQDIVNEPVEPIVHPMPDTATLRPSYDTSFDNDEPLKLTKWQSVQNFFFKLFK